ncbi:MAG: hypothetical protein H6Q30_64 [Bacteroidetes bacterium]|nr:hypothetical protein [Bacteroidota bacterium]
MGAMRNPFLRRAEEGREFLHRLWHLENRDRPGFIIGDVGGPVIGGEAVKSALFSTEGTDTVRDRLRDPAKFLSAQLEEIRGQAAMLGDFVPALCPTLGVIGIPSAFGCEVVWWEKDFPAVRPLPAEDPAFIRNLTPPGVRDGELGRILDHTKYFLEQTASTFPIRLADTQGPLDSAALIMGHNNFFLAMQTHPEEVHRLLEMVTDLIIAFAGAQRELVRTSGAEFIPSMFQPWIPDGYGLSVANDECVMISAEMHDEFSVPYLNRISEAFGGVYIHSCGNWTHQLQSLKKVINLRGVEFGASETPIGPVAEVLGGKTVMACRIGLNRENRFPSMPEFIARIRKSYPPNRGLFIHVDITNGIPGDQWPATDFDEIYRLLGVG